MAWTNGGPGSKIPAAVKRTIRHRQGDRCNTIDSRVCTGTIEQFDHITNIKTSGIERDNANDPDLMQGLCIPCHNVKTQAEALAGRTRGRRQPQQHIGLR